MFHYVPKCSTSYCTLNRNAKIRSGEIRKIAIRISTRDSVRKSAVLARVGLSFTNLGDCDESFFRGADRLIDYRVSMRDAHEHRLVLGWRDIDAVVQ